TSLQSTHEPLDASGITAAMIVASFQRLRAEGCRFDPAGWKPATSKQGPADQTHPRGRGPAESETLARNDYEVQSNTWPTVAVCHRAPSAVRSLAQFRLSAIARSESPR